MNFPQDKTELLGETREARAGAKEFQFVAFFRKQRAQDHESPFLIQQLRRRVVQFVKNKTREALERKNLQPRVTTEQNNGEQLAFELKRGLLRREQNQRWPIWRRFERSADFRQAAESLAAASGAEEEPDLHAPIFSRTGFGAKKINSDYGENQTRFVKPLIGKGVFKESSQEIIPRAEMQQSGLQLLISSLKILSSIGRYIP